VTETQEQKPWKPLPKQESFLSCPAMEVLYAGGKGAGKSQALLVAARMHVRMAGAKVLILRRKFTDLERTLIVESFKFYQGIAKYDSQRKRWTFPNKSYIEFGHCQTRKEMEENYNGAQYSMICIDQVEQFTEDMYNFFLTLLRTSNPQIKCVVRLSANPVGVGRGWLIKRFWIIGPHSKPWNKAHPVTEEIMYPDGRKEALTYHRAFISTTVFDNPHIMSHDPLYVARLQQGGDEKRKALLEGRWDAFDGAFFTEFDERIHVCEPFDIPPNWKRTVAFDWGYNDPMACYWFAEDPSSGKIYVYREFFVNKMLDVDVARNIARFSYGENIESIFYPWDLDFKSGQTGVSMRERMDKEWEYMGIRFYLKVANKDRKNGWSAFRYLLSRRQDGEPNMKIFSTCKNLIETIPQQIHSDNDPEDLDTDGNDHAVDAVRYFAATYRNFYEKPAIPLQVDKRRIPIDVGAALKVGNEYRFKPQETRAPAFAWLGE